MATHSSVLAWRIPGTGEPGGLPSMRSHRVVWSDLAAAAAWQFYFHFYTWHFKARKKMTSYSLNVNPITLSHLFNDKVKFSSHLTPEQVPDGSKILMNKTKQNISKTIHKWIFKIIVQLLLLLLSRFSGVRLCAIPQTAAHQALPSLGFSRQEHRSGLPFPSPMHESEKWKGSRSVVFDS